MNSSPSSSTERLGAYQAGSTDSALWAEEGGAEEEEGAFVAWLILSGQACAADGRARFHRSGDWESDGLDFLLWAGESGRVDQSVHPAKRPHPTEARDFTIAETWTYAGRLVNSWRSEMGKRGVGTSDSIDGDGLDFASDSHGDAFSDAVFEADFEGSVRDAVEETGFDFVEWAEVAEAIPWLDSTDAADFDDLIEIVALKDWLMDPDGEDTGEDLGTAVQGIDPGVWEDGAYRPRKRAAAVKAVASSIDLGDADEFTIAIRGGDWRVCGKYRGTATGAKRHHRAGEPKCRGRSFLPDGDGVFVEDWGERGLSCQDFANLKRARVCGDCGEVFVAPGSKRPRSLCGPCSGADLDAVSAFETDSLRRLLSSHSAMIPAEVRDRLDIMRDKVLLSSAEPRTQRPSHRKGAP